ncbi:hypothetical protein H0H87_010853 [Tephrocybe sp. NHM501043]|nr:hypothetical protein H0H87_010853 [Tephrocybe sp. NHM501043]
MVQQFFVSATSNNLPAPPPPNATSIPGERATVPNDLSSIITLFFSYSALRDWLKLIVIGGIFESFRRLLMNCYHKFIDSFFIRASFENTDPSYGDHYLPPDIFPAARTKAFLGQNGFWSGSPNSLLGVRTRPPFSNDLFNISIGKTRDMQITTRVSGGNSPAVVLEGEEDNSVFLKSSRKISYLPTASLTYSLWYKRRWMTITRVEQPQSAGIYGIYGEKENSLHISIFTRDHGVLTELLQEARRFYMSGQEHTMCIYVSDSGNHWNHVACRAKRSLNSIVLDPGVKDVLLEDARDFLQSKTWYAERGIPFRRGYLLYGAPGSGKTSMIHCMAGELKLDVYVISLSRAGLDDASLSELVNALPERCLALMEDIDAAFTHGVSRGGMSDNDDNIESESKNSKSGQPPPSNAPPAPTPSRLSLSGLLNALDGIGAQEGRILFATTNRYSALDQALCRPGRMDLHIEFKNASKYQARELFNRFYLPTPPAVGVATSLLKGKEPEKSSDPDTVHEKIDSDIAASGFTTLPADLSLFTGQTHVERAPTLNDIRIAELAEQFADAIPDRECSMASLQGYLMSYKTRPVQAAAGVTAWVDKEREGRQEREKEAREKREKEQEKEKKDTKEEDKVKEKTPESGPVSTLSPCHCRIVPTCPTCGGVKPAEDVLVALPSPVSKPASPLVPASELSMTEDTMVSSKA